jgi:SIR2-like domain
MARVVGSQRALAFAGSGVSAPLGYPGWDALIERLAVQTRAACGIEIQSNGQTLTIEQVLHEFKDRPLVQAQILKENLGDHYFPIMTELFGPKDRRIPAIADLVSLPFQHFLTSNYDSGLELHHSPPNEPISICLHDEAAPQFITDFRDDNYSRRVAHVHGRYDEPRHIILTEEDYGRYIQSAVLEGFWRVVPASARLVFFGFGFKDIDLLSTFRRRRMVLRGNNEGNARHFSLMPLDDPDRDNAVTLRMRMEYGIEPVFFPHQPGGNFTRYDDLISMLRLDVVGGIPQQLAEEVAARPPHAVAGSEPHLPIAQGQEPLGEAVTQGVEHLRQLTLSNMARRQTGDLE